MAGTENMDNEEIPVAVTPPSTKQRSWKRLFREVTYLCILGVIMAGVLYSPIFVLESLVVHGNNTLTEDELCDIARIHYGQGLFQLRTDEVTQNLLRDLRIESAVVRRKFPNKLEMDIVEREALATVACDYGYVDFDRQGKVIACYRIFRGGKIPILTGVTVTDLYIGDDNNSSDIGKVISFLSKIDNSLITQLSEINITNLENVMAYTTGGLPIRLGLIDELEQKSSLTQDFLKDLKTTKHSIEYVDFRYAAPVIKLNNIQVIDDKKLLVTKKMNQSEKTGVN